MNKKTIKKNKGAYWILDKHYAIDLSLSRNPLGCSKIVQQKVNLRTVDISEYPDSSELIQAISSHFSIPQKHLSIDGGIDGFINFLPQVFLKKGDNVVLPKPSFPRFEMAIRAFGGQPIFIPLRGMRVDFESMGKKIIEKRPKMILIANPNNPTGLFEDKEKILQLVKKTQSLVVVDEAGIDFADKDASLIQEATKFKNLIVLRGFSKGYGLSGLRVAFCVASPDIISQFNSKHLTFPVSAIAVRAAALALTDQKHLEKTRALFKKEGRFYQNELEKMGFRVLPPESNLIFAQVPSCFRSAQELIEELHRKDIHCVDGQNFGLAKYVRINPSIRKINKKFIQAVKEIIQKIK
jgi:histidinol-phosphate aminotransferase